MAETAEMMEIQSIKVFVPVERIDEVLKKGLITDEALAELPNMDDWLTSITRIQGGSLN